MKLITWVERIRWLESDNAALREALELAVTISDDCCGCLKSYANEAEVDKIRSVLSGEAGKSEHCARSK